MAAKINRHVCSYVVGEKILIKVGRGLEEPSYSHIKSVTRRRNPDKKSSELFNESDKKITENQSLWRIVRALKDKAVYSNTHKNEQRTSNN